MKNPMKKNKLALNYLCSLIIIGMFAFICITLSPKLKKKHMNKNKITTLKTTNLLLSDNILEINIITNDFIK